MFHHYQNYFSSYFVFFTLVSFLFYFKGSPKVLVSSDLISTRKLSGLFRNWMAPFPRDPLSPLQSSLLIIPVAMPKLCHPWLPILHLRLHVEPLELHYNQLADSGKITLMVGCLSRHFYKPKFPRTHEEFNLLKYFKTERDLNFALTLKIQLGSTLTTSRYFLFASNSTQNKLICKKITCFILSHYKFKTFVSAYIPK